MQARRGFGLPCPWAPLQSVTTAASREVPFRHEGAVYLRGKATNPLDAACCASGTAHTPEGVWAESPMSGGADPGDSEAGLLEAECKRRVEGRPKRRLNTVRRHKWQRRARTWSQRASPGPEPKRGNGCFLEARSSTEAESRATKPPH
jgi:hypothetical protein